MLSRAVESALQQTYRDFELLISDNMSDDRTREVVESFDDPRIRYERSDVNVGMIGNFNRLISLTTTEFLVMLPDDDLLYPEYLASTFEVIDQRPGLGVVHTGFDLIDELDQAIESGRQLVPGHGVIFESGEALIERGMRSSGLVCWTSALFRTAAVASADGLRLEDEPFADGPLMMRIGIDWDFACIAEPLAAVRIHREAASASVGSFEENRYDPGDDINDALYRQRRAFIEESVADDGRKTHYLEVAKASFRRDTVGRMTIQLRAGGSRKEIASRLGRLVRNDGRLLIVPATWKLAAFLVVPKRRPRPVRAAS
jgi:glycosyltransferase involved in cell wall biosynthesis